ncbi:hypothetical protein ACFL6U_06455 [Planctomycetota bacterium]
MTRMPAVSMMPVTTCRPKKHLAWWPDWEFTNDLLLDPKRPRLSDISLTAEEDLFTTETIIDICLTVENTGDHDLADLRINAVILDDFGMIMTKSATRLTAAVDTLTAHSRHSHNIAWQRDCPKQAYNLVLVLEDNSGNMLDVISGEFTLA